MADEIPTRILDVWDFNLELVFNQIRSAAANKFHYVAMDTEFPGKVHQDARESAYRKMKANVDHLKIIQIGLTLFDENCKLPYFESSDERLRLVWQFNFREFNEAIDAHAKDSIALLKASGINFGMNLRKGISAVRFRELLLNSGLVMNKNVRWVTFHGGYDCGYLIRLLINQNLPDTEEQFRGLLTTYLNLVYDIKHVTLFCKGVEQGGLKKMSSNFGISRDVGTAHQAGSDSLLTFKLYRHVITNYEGSAGREHAGYLEMS